MGKIIISVIVTTYNSEEYIQKTIDGIRDQEGAGHDFEIELIVVDDCSSDSTRYILQANNIDFISTSENSGGPNVGRNIGLKKSSGDYICIADHDDEWLPFKLKSQLDVAHLAPIITSGHTVINKSTNRITKCVSSSSLEHLFFEKDSTFISRLIKSKTGQNTYIGSIMFSSKLSKIRFEEHFGVVDYDWYLRLFEGQSSVEVNRSLYNRIVFDSNLSLNSKYRARDFCYSLYSLEPYWDNYPKECKTAYKRINGSLARYYYFIGEMSRARFYFKYSGISLKTIMYYLTTFAGSKYVKKRFNVFG